MEWTLFSGSLGGTKVLKRLQKAESKVGLCWWQGGQQGIVFLFLRIPVEKKWSPQVKSCCACLHFFHLHDDKNQTNTDENDNPEQGKYYNLILTQVLVLVMMLILVLFWEPIASISFVFGIKPHSDSCPLHICLLTFGEHFFVKKLHIEKRWEYDKKVTGDSTQVTQDIAKLVFGSVSSIIASSLVSGPLVRWKGGRGDIGASSIKLTLGNRGLLVLSATDQKHSRAALRPELQLLNTTLQIYILHAFYLNCETTPDILRCCITYHHQHRCDYYFWPNIERQHPASFD